MVDDAPLPPPCPTCNDTGVVELPLGDESDYSDLRDCPDCSSWASDERGFKPLSPMSHERHFRDHLRLQRRVENLERAFASAALRTLDKDGPGGLRRMLERLADAS